MAKLYLIDEAAGILDEVQAWLLAKRDKQGRHTAYDYALDRDQKALACAIRALVQCVPSAEKEKPEPPKKLRKPARKLSPAQRTVYNGKPSWNHQPKRDWDGTYLPPLPDLPGARPTQRPEDASGGGDVAGDQARESS